MEAAFSPKLELSQEKDIHKQEITEQEIETKRENLVLQLKNALLEQENRLRLPPGNNNQDDKIG